MAIADIRREYDLTGLKRSDLAKDPIQQFQTWFLDAAAQRGTGRWRRFFVGLYKSFSMLACTPPPDVNAMTLATVDNQGRPSARIVLLKGVDHRGFVFFTNYESRKGQDLADNPQAALVFYWPELERQICIGGRVEKLPAAESDLYFSSRPRGSQIAAWASRQSEVVANRSELGRSWAEFEKKFARAVPRPPHWGGYVLIPENVEFWQGRPNRLHDRFQFSRNADGSWSIDRLAP